ncbi:DUF1624 domain-containing protein [Dyadobacter sp. NIV53]|uniref:DUF1624 domain-containing protein n=1 Tax=Dyadobacter sp. NIV53 TaxID=2861765 RepID=UPI001E37EB4F|nr:heparan-alpha-glucosaminide N-acetyltransferase domain-containing protein [Dyadobacter sp. NIV53]
MMLSGISAYLSGKKKTVSETSGFLVKRGLWLIIVEILVMTLILSFDFKYKIIILNILWALGTSMLILGLLVRFLPVKSIFIVGIVLVFGHNLLDFVKVIPDSPLDIFLSIFLTGAGKFIPRGDGGTIGIFYVILPWTGIMLSGYGLGQIYDKNIDVLKRKKLLLMLGIGGTFLFLILRLLNGYGDPSLWVPQKEEWRTVLSFFNVTKYPPSLLFTLMTLGPILILLAFTDSTNNKFTKFVSVYGKVPFFYFIIHFLLIHITSAIVVLLSGYTWEQATDEKLFFKFRPEDFGFELGWVYLIWISIVLVMYFPCKWFGKYKSGNKKWWLSYL